MLPYKLRDPLFSPAFVKEQKREAKRRGQKYDERWKRRYTMEDGGPLERAVKLDLESLHAEVVTEYQRASQHQHPISDSNGHHAPGHAFGIYKKTFRKFKMALLHTRIVPPRCERDAYSQALYSSCLAMIETAFSRADNCMDLLQSASYALFSLYCLYETNPLPKAPDPNTAPSSGARKGDFTESDMSIMNMLPIGQFSYDNPKLLYRRAWKCPVRISRKEYMLFMRLRDEALAHQNNCQEKRMHSCQKCCNILDSKNSLSSLKWKCFCATATDAIFILDRMMIHKPCFEYCESSGPNGLEGLAGHRDYGRMLSSRTRTAKSIPAHKQSNKLDVPEADQQSVDIQSILDLEGMASKVKEYTSRLESVSTFSSISTKRRVGVDHQDEMTKRKLSSLVKKQAEVPWDTFLPWLTEAHEIPEVEGRQGAVWDRWARAAATNGTGTTIRLLARKYRFRGAVSLPPALLEGGKEVDDDDDEANALETVATSGHDGSQKEHGNPEEETISYRIILPAGMPQSLQDGIHTHLGAIGDEIGELFDLHNAEDKTVQPEDSSVLIDTDHNEGTESIVTRETGVGRAALRDLLATAASSGKGDTKAGVASTGLSRDAFLSMQPMIEEGDDEEDGANDELSAVSELSFSSEDDDVSVATSAIGRNALKTLLCKVDASVMPEKKRAQFRGKRSVSRSSKPRRDVATAKPSGKKRSVVKRKGQASKNKGIGDSTSVASSRVGRAALDALLAKAALSEEDDEASLSTENDETNGKEVKHHGKRGKKKESKSVQKRKKLPTQTRVPRKRVRRIAKQRDDDDQVAVSITDAKRAIPRIDNNRSDAYVDDHKLGDGNIGGDLSSVGSSLVAGRAALTNLLAQAATKTKQKRRKAKNTEAPLRRSARNRRRSSDDDNATESLSIASGSTATGAGRRALRKLLRKV